MDKEGLTPLLALLLAPDLALVLALDLALAQVRALAFDALLVDGDAAFLEGDAVAIICSANDVLNLSVMAHPR